MTLKYVSAEKYKKYIQEGMTVLNINTNLTGKVDEVIGETIWIRETYRPGWKSSVEIKDAKLRLSEIKKKMILEKKN